MIEIAYRELNKTLKYSSPTQEAVWLSNAEQDASANILEIY